MLLRTVHPCEEFSAISVPLHELLANGELQIYPEIANKGLFDIDFAGGELVLKATRYVGIIPISDKVAIHVRPRVGISNLMYLLWRSGGSSRYLRGFDRKYQLSDERVASPEELYLETYLSSLRQICRNGLIKRYQSQVRANEYRGRIVLTDTIVRALAKGVRGRVLFDVRDFGVDCLENQIIKSTATKLFKHAISNPRVNRSGETNELGELIRSFDAVSNIDIAPGVVGRMVPSLVRALPARYSAYEGPLWLSMLLATGDVVSLENIGGIRFETLVIDVSSVFERYVRKLCQESDETSFQNLRFLDGNLKPVRLFVRGERSETKPDIYVVRQGEAIAVIDVKYKPRLSAADRYELLGFCEALGVKHAAFICPAMEDLPSNEIYGVTKSGISVHILRILLGSDDRERAETNFLVSLKNFLASA